MDTEKMVLDTLKSSKAPLKAGELAEKTGMNKNEVDKAIKKLVNDQLVDSPKRCYYAAK
jgi:predicted transcriptional regulator